jgi:hypothetical protein
MDVHDHTIRPPTTLSSSTTAMHKCGVGRGANEALLRARADAGRQHHCNRDLVGAKVTIRSPCTVLGWFHRLINLLFQTNGCIRKIQMEKTKKRSLGRTTCLANSCKRDLNLCTWFRKEKKEREEKLLSTYVTCLLSRGQECIYMEVALLTSLLNANSRKRDSNCVHGFDKRKNEGSKKIC